MSLSEMSFNLIVDNIPLLAPIFLIFIIFDFIGYAFFKGGRY